jgi:hypothetical protein
MHCPSDDIDLVPKSLLDCPLDQVTIVTSGQNNQFINPLWDSIVRVRLVQVVFYLPSVGHRHSHLDGPPWGGKLTS